MGLLLPHGRRGGRDGAAPPVTGGVVTDRIAIVLAAGIIAAILGDIALNDSAALVFALRKLADFVEKNPAMADQFLNNQTA